MPKTNRERVDKINTKTFNELVILFLEDGLPLLQAFLEAAKKINEAEQKVTSNNLEFHTVKGIMFLQADRLYGPGLTMIQLYKKEI